MRHASLADLSRAGVLPGQGPVALILAEDPVEVASTLAHLAGAGFALRILFADPAILPDLPPAPDLIRVDCPVNRPGGAIAAVNAAIPLGIGRWMHYAYNAEYLIHPFNEDRSIAEMLAFHTEERRDAMLTYVIDLYAGDLTDHPGGVAVQDAWLDRSGYYALARIDPITGYPVERQLDFYGGLRWRFEEHVAQARRRIDRIGLFRARAGLHLRADHTFDMPEYNTYACPWHNNLTAAICSFRAAKALRTNAGSRHDIPTFRWHNSIPFGWKSQQLLDLGLIEPGQWF